ncbi:hypothetical protein FQN49_001187 [Arthroderma sp. PD_2]|nr:hypothetical protein FQN49_001187 [Arthroderma sp. PD_2]
MSFAQSARNIRIEDNRVLIAELQNENGDFVDAQVDLDEFLGNDEGCFQWEGCGFSQSAVDVWLEINQDTGLPILRAKLGTSDGDQYDADVNLSERISNNNGSFEFQ